MSIHQLTDKRQLHLLNRFERRGYLAYLKTLTTKMKETTLIDLKQTIEAYDHDGNLIKNKDGNVLTLKEMLLYSLRAAHQTDTTESHANSAKRYALVKRMAGADELELTKDEKNICIDRVHKFLVQIEVKGRITEILEQDTPAATPAPEGSKP